jgi:hypothetical protein
MNAQEHLLTTLVEECSEVAKTGCKSLRFGLNDRSPLDPGGPTNLERLVYELNDLVAVVNMLEDVGVVPHGWQNQKLQADKQGKVAKFMGYAIAMGTLSSAPTSAPAT